MRHLLFPIVCATLAACAAPGAPRPESRFTLERGQAVELAPGLSLHFDEVEDSRCPPGVYCVWAGKLSYRFSIRRAGAAPETFTLSPGAPGATPATLDGRRIVLIEDTIPAPPAPGTSLVYRASIRIVPSTLPTTP